MSNTPREIHREILECGFQKCCPVVSLFDDGSATLTDDDAELGSIGTIKLTPEAAARFVELLSKRA